MKSYKLLALLCALFTISGCGSSLTNVIGYNDDYYKGSLAKSKNTQALKDYLKQNNIKLGLFISTSNLPSGGLSAVMLGGTFWDYTNQASIDWLNSYMTTLPSFEFSGLTQDAAGYTLTYCGDFTHANIGEDAQSGSMEYTYFLSKMTTNDHQLFLHSSMLSNCEIKEILGNVFYMKKIHVSSNASIAKVSAVLKDKSQPLNPNDTFSLIIKDMADQAMTAMLTDEEMLQAFKTFRLTGDKLPAPEKPMTISPASQEPISQNQSLNLGGYKAQCKDLGFKVGTADYGNCVLQLNDAK